MALREILDYSHPALRSQTTELDAVTDDIRELLQDMAETMDHAWGVGLAGPQIGVLQRLFVYDIGEGPHAVINPRVLRASGEEAGTEGCLSIPRLHGEVPRASKLTLTYLDENGKRCKETVEGFRARIFQHEIDHLYGVLFTDKVIPGTLHMVESTEEDREREVVAG